MDLDLTTSETLEKIDNMVRSYNSHLSVLFTGHLNNLHDTCLWMLVKGGETENKAHEFLKVLICMNLSFISFSMHIPIKRCFTCISCQKKICILRVYKSV